MVLIQVVSLVERIHGGMFCGMLTLTELLV
jgi:hypothetical protein